jgi:hypothetical protein
MQFNSYWSGRGYDVAAFEVARQSSTPDADGKLDPHALDAATWHLSFSGHLADFQAWATAMCSAHCVTSEGERLHKEFGLVHTKPRNLLAPKQTARLAHLHMHLRLKGKMAKVGWRSSVLEWAKQSVIARARADERAAHAAEELAGVAQQDFVVGGFLHTLLS